METSLVEALSAELDQAPASLDDLDILATPADRSVGEAMLAALAGASSHAMGLAPPASVPRLPGSRPPPPLYRRPGAWLSTAAAVVVLTVGAFELNSYQVQKALKEKHRLLSERQAVLEARKREAEAARRAEDEAKKKLEAVQSELQIVELRKGIYTGILNEHDRFMESLLDAVVDRISEEVLLDSLEETGWQQVRVQGFALSVDSIYRYARAVAGGLEAFEIKLGDVDTAETQGPSGLKGYRFGFMLLNDPKGKV